jgi:hypothetical protein
LQVTEENLVSRASPSRDLTSRAVVETCSDQLVAIATAMNQNLTDLLTIMQAQNHRIHSVSFGPAKQRVSSSARGSANTFIQYCRSQPMQFGLHHSLHSFVDNYDLVLCPSYAYLRHGWESNARNSVEETTVLPYRSV